MAGVRIAPSAETLRYLGYPSMAGRPWALRDISRPFTGPPWPGCPAAGTVAECPGGVHYMKTYHWTFDQDGSVTVSRTVWEKIKMLYDQGGMVEVNIVRDPPVQHLILPTVTVEPKPSNFG